MKSKIVLFLISFSTLLLTNLNNATASLNSSIDYSNTRIVPFLTSINSDTTAGSGFLYSSRLVFTSGHLSYGFDRNGNKVPLVRENFVGLPNTKVTSSSPRVKVIKQFVAPNYRFNEMGLLDDFAVFVLEKDLTEAKPVALLTPELEKELVSKNASVSLHGYGNFQDSCQDGQMPPCKVEFKPSSEPRTIPATLHKMNEFKELVGYTQEDFANELLYFTPGKTSMCSGDSGGSLTTIYNGNLLYLSNIGTAFRIYACGQSNFDGKGGINYSAPIYRFTNLIKEAEEFVRLQIESEKSSKATISTTSKSAKVKKSITCKKGKTVKKIVGFDPKCPIGFKRS